MSLPLEGVHVVEVAHYVAVPAAGALLADMGAEVIKVEQPPEGEIYRRGRLRFMGIDHDFSEYPPFQMENRGKRSIALDLTRPEARAALLRLIDRAEVFITNLLPARRTKYGLDHVSLLARRPGLVVGAISGYGLQGPNGDTPAFDYTAYWARTGMMDAMRDEGVDPSLLRPGVGDHSAAMNLVCGILAAMRLRDATGEGRYVDVSLMQSGFHALGNDVANALVARQPVPRHNRRAPLNPLWNSYPVAEGRWLLLVMIDPNRYWPKLCAVLERSEWLEDPRFADGFARAAHSAELVRELEAVFAERTLEEWRPRMDQAELIWAPVLRTDEAVADPEAHAAGCFYEIEHESAGRFETVAPPFRIEGVPLGARRAAPPLGSDGETILREAGLEDSEIEKLR